MVQTCRTCQRTNPAEAVFCHFDGTRLEGAGRSEVFRHAVAGQFVHPFVFAGGQVCHSYAELASAACELWDEARQLLRQGVFQQFLAGLGRVDLARAAREAADFPDPDVGLDRFLAALPGDVLAPPVLEVQPLEVNLGMLTVGQDSRFHVQLRNSGMRLVHGTLRALDPWLVVAPGGQPSKMFRFSQQEALTVTVQGNRLRAGNKPLEGKLVFESSGGTRVVSVHATVPVKPFPDGLFAGARTPREIAVKARENPHEAARFFETGEVVRWYQDNGWTYPVQTPPASGVTAVQQFFEALGLVKPPVVEISASDVSLQGEAGGRLDYTLEVRTREPRLVYASAVSDQPWLHVGHGDAQGPVVKLPLTIPEVPADLGAFLTAQVTVTANGNQRFQVPVRLTVVGGGAGPTPLPLPVVPSLPPPLPVRDSVPSVRPPPTPPAPPAQPRPLPVRLALHLTPVLLLGGILLAFVLRDALSANRVVEGPAPEPGEPIVTEEPIQIDPTPRLSIAFHDRRRDAVDRKVVPPTMRFGITMRGADAKKLTYDAFGRTNNTCLRINGRDELFGSRSGAWVEQGQERWQDPDGTAHEGMRSIWRPSASPGLTVTQMVELIPGQVMRDDEGRLVRAHDTCLVRYLLHNDGPAAQIVGLRFLLDTLIGTNDGVPFFLPGEKAGIDTQKVLARGTGVPDYLFALEENNLEQPGTVARVVFKLGGGIEMPDRVTLGAWPHDLLGVPSRGPMTMWNVPVRDIQSITRHRDRDGQPLPPDSAVCLYWEPRALAPGARRTVGFAYGLGRIAGDEAGGKLAVLGDVLARPGQPFTVQALVSNPVPGQKLTLNLPAGLRLAEGSDASQEVPPPPAGSARAQSSVTWRVIGDRAGTYTFTVQASTNVSQSRAVSIRATGSTPGTTIFDP